MQQSQENIQAGESCQAEFFHFFPPTISIALSVPTGKRNKNVERWNPKGSQLEGKYNQLCATWVPPPPTQMCAGGAAGHWWAVGQVRFYAWRFKSITDLLFQAYFLHQNLNKY